MRRILRTTAYPGRFNQSLLDAMLTIFTLLGRILLALYVAIIPWLGTSLAAPVVPVVSLAQDFSLRLGQSAMVTGAGLTVTFQAVLEDSRCPVDTDCVWAGNAKIVLDVVNAQGNRVAVVLNTGIEPSAARVGSFELRLVSLAPQPRVMVPILQSEYTVTLRVVELSKQS